MKMRRSCNCKRFTLQRLDPNNNFWQNEYTPFYNQNNAAIKCSLSLQNNAGDWAVSGVKESHMNHSLLTFTDNAKYHKVVLGGCFHTLTIRRGTWHERILRNAIVPQLCGSIQWSISENVSAECVDAEQSTTSKKKKKKKKERLVWGLQSRRFDPGSNSRRARTRTDATWFIRAEYKQNAENK